MELRRISGDYDNLKRIGGQTMTTQHIAMRDAFGQALTENLVCYKL
jgi:hypothetical protein